MLNTAFFIVGASSKLAGATAHGHVRRYPALLHDTIAIIRLQPHHSYNPGRRVVYASVPLSSWPALAPPFKSP